MEPGQSQTFRNEVCYRAVYREVDPLNPPELYHGIAYKTENSIYFPPSLFVAGTSESGYDVT
jgi:hypothetical protein